ncbi:MAG: polysaccharide pyruvyl transferase family protein, partial [Terriglobia bacterium]
MLSQSDVFICGYYGFGNTGDELILAAILCQLRDRITDCKVTVMSGHPAWTSERFGVRAIHWRDPDAMLRAVEHSRLVVIGGGGLFHDYAGAVPDAILTSSNAGIGLHAAVALAASLQKKPLLLWNVGVGPLFSQHGRDLVRYIASVAAAITVRDSGSALVLRELGIDPDRIVLAADPVFSSTPPETRPAQVRAYFPQIEEEAPVIGVALRYWDRGADLDYWTRQLAEGLDLMSSRTGARFVFISLQAEPAVLENDTLIARRVAAQMTFQGRIHVLEAVLDPEETWGVLGSCDVVVGMRLHAVLLAACSGVPALSLSYDPKGSSAADELGLREFELPVGSITGDRFASLLELLADSRAKLRPALKLRCEGLRERATQTADIAQALLADAPPVSHSPTDATWLYSVAIRAQAKAGAAAEARVSELEHHQRGLLNQARKLEAIQSDLAASRAEVEPLRAILMREQALRAEFERESARWAAETQDVKKSLAETKQSADATKAALESAHAALRLVAAARTQKSDATQIELRGWTDQQATHIRELAEWTQKQAVQIEGLKEEIARLQGREGSASRGYEHRARRLAMGPFRRAAHLALDGLQNVIPQHVRERVRPVYLPLYRRWFPNGQAAALVPSPPVLRLPASSPAAAQSRPPVFIPRAPLAKSPLPLSDYAPKVSVVLPVWNHSGLLVGSIRSVLGQTWRNLELIIIDDGSEADLIDPIREAVGDDPRVRVLRRPHEGLPQTLSAGFRFATGEFFTWTSADNVMNPDMIETLVGFLRRRPDVDMTYADMDLIGADGLPLFNSDYRVTAQRPGATNELRLPRTIRTLSIVNDNFVGACFLYRAEMGRILGDYDAARLGTEDYDYWLRLSALGRIEHLDSDRCLYSYRVHNDPISGRHTPVIAKNAVQLVDYHRERLGFFEHPFSVAIIDGGGTPSFRILAAALRQSGHNVTVIGETDSERGHSAVEAWWNDAKSHDSRVKGLLICRDSAL